MINIEHDQQNPTLYSYIVETFKKTIGKQEE